MLNFLAVACLFFDSPLISELDALAQKRDIAGVASATGQDAAKFRFLRGDGAYGVGRYGWHVLGLKDPTTGTELAVFSTKITSQDIGEPVFEIKDGKLGRLIEEDETGGFKMDHLSLSAQFVPAEKKAILTAKTDFSRTAEKAGPLLLRMSEHYKVSAITDGAGKPVEFIQSSGVIAVKAPAEKTFSLNLSYSGIVNLPSFAGAITNDEVMLTNDYWWPIHSRKPIAFDCNVTVPSDWTAVTNGNLVETKSVGNQMVFSYKCDVPICYLSLSAAKFEVASKVVKGITYKVWSKEMSKQQMDQQLEFYPPIIEYYSQFKKHPFNQYGAVVTRLYGGGALEAYSYATYGTGWLPDEDGHEPAHTWFGGIIPNTYLKSFWNESFAEFMDNMYRREGPVGDPVDKRLAFAQQFGPSPAYDNAECFTAGASSGGVASALGYGKGGAVLQQLEVELGHDKMVAAIKKWLAGYPNGNPGEWQGFEAAVGPEMKWFFDQWLRRKGSPKFSLADVKKVGNKITGRVLFDGAPYRLAMDTLLRGPKGDTVVKTTFNPTGMQQDSSFTVDCPADTTLVAFDPYDRLIRRRGPSPLRFSSVSRFKVVVDPKHPKWTRVSKPAEWDGKTLNGFMFVGSPETMPVLKELCKKVGFVVSAGKLTYRGKTISLEDGAGVAVVDLGDGQKCGIQIGNLDLDAKTGNATVAMVDKLGRFLKGYTYPRIEGDLAMKVQ